MNYTAMIEAAERNGASAVSALRMLAQPNWKPCYAQNRTQLEYEAWMYAMRAARYALDILGRD